MKSYTVQVAVGVLSLTLLAACSTQRPMQTESMQNAPQQDAPKQDMAKSPELMQNRQSMKNVQAESMQDAVQSERLGTKWGDEVNSQVTSVDLRRVSDEPIEQMQVYYADKRYTGRTLNSRSLVAGKVDFSVATDNGKIPLFRDGSNYYLQGQAGQAYRLVYQNNSANTYEIVASVDGLNVLDGSTASRYDGGYVLRPNDELVIEGFRKSQNAVASFIFSKPENAYAANTPAGSINNTGVIGSVIYQLYDPKKARPLQPQAFPSDNGYAKAPK